MQTAVIGVNLDVRSHTRVECRLSRGGVDIRDKATLLDLLNKVALELALILQVRTRWPRAGVALLVVHLLSLYGILQTMLNA